MATVFKLTLDKNGNAGLLSIVGEIRRNSHLKQVAEKESANGYIMSNSAPCGGSLRFDITTIIGDIENDSNALFDFVKATVDEPERYAYTQGQLKDYFADADFSVQLLIAGAWACSAAICVLEVLGCIQPSAVPTVCKLIAVENQKVQNRENNLLDICAGIDSKAFCSCLSE